MKSAPELAQQVGQMLKQKGKFLVTAESCTGGGIAYAITEVAGSSSWFDRGVITYSNASKTELLGVPARCIELYGAVSEEVAAAMAEGALLRSSGHIAVAVTGIAGPSGGVPGKPVGTVFFAWTMGEKTTIQRQVFQGSRSEIRSQTVAFALQGVLNLLET